MRLRLSKDVESKLDALEKDSTLPETTALYNQIIDSNTKAGTYDREYAMRALQWILGAVHDLPIDELAKAVSIDTHGVFDEEVDSIMVLELCSNLVVVDDLGTCRLAHLSVRDFLVQSDGRKPQSGLFTREQVHCQIAIHCLSYLATIDVSTDEHCHQCQATGENFGSYAIFNWAFHCGQARELRTTDPFSSLFLPFVSPLIISPQFARWTIAITKLLGQVAAQKGRLDGKHEDPTKPDSPPSSSISRHSVDLDQRVHSDWSLGRRQFDHFDIADTATEPTFPAFVASMFGFLEVLEITPVADLLLRKARAGDSCLHFGTFSADAATFLLTIDGVDPAVTNDSGSTPLHVASMLGRDDVINLLLGRMTRSQICLQDRNGETALHKVSYGAHSDCVKTLIGNLEPDDLTLVDRTGNTVLQHAVRSRNRDVTTTIINAMRPEDVAIKNSEESTALHVRHFSESFFLKSYPFWSCKHVPRVRM